MKPVPTYVLLQWEQGVNRSRSVPGELSSVGEPSIGACIGASFCSCLLVRGYASAAAGYVSPAELPLCAALIRGGSISRHPPPTESHRSGNQSTTGSGFEPLAFA